MDQMEYFQEPLIFSPCLLPLTYFEVTTPLTAPQPRGTTSEGIGETNVIITASITSGLTVPHSAL